MDVEARRPGQAGAGGSMEFGVLGPVQARLGGQIVDLGHARQRAVLAVLLLDAGHVVPFESLIGRVWGDDPPASVRNALHVYITRLRTVLASSDGGALVLARRAGGYAIEAEREHVDVFRFRRLAAAAAAARSGDDRRAAELLGEALKLWRGQALAGLDSRWLNAMRDSLELERRAAAADLNDVRLRLGEHAALAGELAGQAAAAPADDRLIGQLMLALYRCGRQSDALRCYDQARRQLATDLGAEPGPALQELRRQILRADPALALTPAATPAAVAVTTSARPTTLVPRELPADVAGFTGRAAEIAALDELLLRPHDGAGAAAAVISAVSGTAGVGKTALAVHWAHHAAAHFPDGQLHVNLRGYDPDQPVAPAEALAGFLRSLGVPGQQVPPGETERAARYRSMLAGKRMLIVLDNAATVGQVRPLLPGNSACCVLVTSRDSLAGLIARDGARRLDLDLLPRTDAVGLLRQLVGDRADDDPDAVAELAEQCARLPLALRIAAEIAIARPATPLASLAAELADEQQRLDLLDADGDPRTAIRAVFSWSYEHLDPAAALAFRLAGLHPGPSFDAYALCALTGGTLDQARQALAALTRASLIQPAAPGRYVMHDLLRAYARDLAATAEGQAAKRTALTRLFDHYLHAASAAMDVFHPAEQYRRPRIPPAVTPTPPLTGPAQALAWLDEQRDCLVAAAQYAVDHGQPSVATGLSATLYRYFDLGSHCADGRTVHSCALRAARQRADRTAEGIALNGLGGIDLIQGRYQQAGHHHRQALAVFEESGDRANQAHVLNSLGNVAHHQGAYQTAADHYRQALALHRQISDRNGQAVVLGNLGAVFKSLGRYRSATNYYRQALVLYRETGNRNGEAVSLGNIGTLCERQGRYQQAAVLHQQALALHRAMGNRNGEAIALNNLGIIEQRLDRHQQAITLHQQAFNMHRETGDRSMQAAAMNNLGQALLAGAEPSRARAQYAAALEIAGDIGDKYEQGRAHAGLGDAHQAEGEADSALDRWRQALALFTELGVPEAKDVQARLAARSDTVAS